VLERLIEELSLPQTGRLTVGQGWRWWIRFKKHGRVSQDRKWVGVCHCIGEDVLKVHLQKQFSFEKQKFGVRNLDYPASLQCCMARTCPG
jgi:hypothetical protein